MNEQNDKALAYSVLVLVLLFLAMAWWICRSGTPGNVSDQRDRAVQIGKQLGKAEDKQREIQQGARDATERANSVEKSINDAAVRAGDLRSQIEGDRATIEECEYILSAVRQRGKAKAPGN